MNGLPSGWVIERLENLTSKIGSGSTPRGGSEVYQTTGVPLIRSMNVRFEGFKYDGLAFISGHHAEQLKSVEVHGNDVLLNITGASIGRVTLAPQEFQGARVNQHVAIVRALDGLEPIYLQHFLASPESQSLIFESESGMTRQALTKEKLESFEIPLAPLNEQKRIAEKLEALLTQATSSLEKLNRASELVKRFRQSVLAAATSGVLTEDWRKESSRSRDDWRRVGFSDIGSIGRGKSRHRPRNDLRLYGGPYPFIQTGDIAQSDEYIFSHSQTYSEFGLEQSKLWPEGTVCITIAANIADTAILTYPACFPDSVVGFVSDTKKAIPQFVKWSIDVIRDDLESFAPATAQKNINLAVLTDVVFDCPPLPEQLEIVSRVETLFALADQLETRISTARAQLERLTPALLAKAFRGELVPQDPNDEPATLLLERIREARASQPKERKPRQTKHKTHQVSSRGGGSLQTSAQGSVETPPSTDQASLFTAGGKTVKRLEEALKSRADTDVKGRPYLTAKVKRMDGKVKVERLYQEANLELVDFFKQLSEEYDQGWLRQSDDQVEAV